MRRPPAALQRAIRMRAVRATVGRDPSVLAAAPLLLQWLHELEKAN